MTVISFSVLSMHSIVLPHFKVLLKKSKFQMRQQFKLKVLTTESSFQHHSGPRERFKDTLGCFVYFVENMDASSAEYVTVVHGRDSVVGQCNAAQGI
jgi:hypothetical protein